VSAQLPRNIAALLETVSTTKSAAEVVAAARDLLEISEGLGDLARSFEAFREMARVFGILEENRNGQRILDGWSKLAHLFGESRRNGARAILDGSGTEVSEAPSGFEAVAGRWERIVPELDLFEKDEREIERSLAEQPVSASTGLPFRSRLLLLDRRAERIKVACDLLRRDLALAARSGLHRLGTGGRSDPEGGS
jgi:hypothetical protein